MMTRMRCCAVLGGLVWWISTAAAHFPFIVPENNSKAVVVFSDNLAPDTNVNIEKIADTRLTLRQADGQESKLEWTKGMGCYQVTLPAGELRVVYGVTEYGVLQKGEAPPFRLIYYPKAVLGNATDPRATVGGKLPLEICAEGKAGEIRFRVLRQGQPAAEAEVTILLPEGGKQTVKTDKEGYTPVFRSNGRYGLWTRWIEPKKGEHAGRTYAEIRHYATLVCDINDK
ncbi:MAG: DUF4198 domain-containing protein [Gemmataceae bacterium]|nr:DUF4198 domain-containing protein [Gemmataceae bacterium]MDW8242142.1 DUF4198 domain-containing protein [Thermogemmata sp.]